MARGIALGPAFAQPKDGDVDDLDSGVAGPAGELDAHPAHS